MANMFSGNQEKKIPKNFKDCYKTDSITKNLWLWCERLEKWGKILYWILIVIGVVDTIIAGVNAHQFIEEIGAETVEEIREASAEMGIEIPTVFEALVNNLFSWTLYSFLEYCAYHILALLVGSLASIVQHTKITANLTLYNSAKAENIADDYVEEVNNVDSKESKTNKKPKKCNLWVHQNYIGEISSTDSDSENAHWEINNSLNTKTLVCNQCGKKLIVIDDFNRRIKICPRCGRNLRFESADGYGECPFCDLRVK